jgi:hypothetical protein
VVNFYDSSTAGSATIDNFGSSYIGAGGGQTLFHNTSTASDATLSAWDGFSAEGGAIFFTDGSIGGTARVGVFGNGNLDISNHNAPGVTIGSIEGNGNVFLGANNLTVGSNGLSTTFSGAIQDGGGTGGSLAKIGSGILTFQGRATNDYIADTVSLRLVSCSIIDLEFFGTPDTICSLTVNGVPQMPGLYGGPDSGAPHQLPEFAGTGTVEVTCTPSETNQAGGAEVAIHITRASATFQERSGAPSREAEIERAPIPVPPTRSTFVATWPSISGATSYHLDVSTNSGFGSYVNGYRDLDVGQITSRVVTGLKPGTTYHYRVRAYNSRRILSSSAVKTVTTAGGTGLVINPDYDSSITPAIQDMIQRAISIYESLFNDPITPPVSILFRYATTRADGCTPLPDTTLALSQSVSYGKPWNDFVSALGADA